jgi:hypothetical protein
LACELTYIPERLHCKDRPDLPIFFVGEEIYRRSKASKIEETFSQIDLRDISVNRRGDPGVESISQPDDVLFNLDPSNGLGEKLVQRVAILEIKSIAPCGTYEKSFSLNGQDGNGNPVTNTAGLKLIHKKLDCNYAHSAFAVAYNGEIVDQVNYKKTIGKGSASELRTQCKMELAAMIVREEIRV